MDAIPAHMRRFDLLGKAGAGSWKQRGARSLRGFGAALEQPLHAYADAKKRCAPGDRREDRLPQLKIESLTAAEVTHARHHDLTGRGDDLRFRGQFGLGSYMLQG